MLFRQVDQVAAIGRNWFERLPCCEGGALLQYGKSNGTEMHNALVVLRSTADHPGHAGERSLFIRDACHYASGACEALTPGTNDRVFIRPRCDRIE